MVADVLVKIVFVTGNDIVHNVYSLSIDIRFFSSCRLVTSCMLLQFVDRDAIQSEGMRITWLTCRR